MKKISKTKIALLGLGLENQSLLKLLDKHKAPVDITICDYREIKDLVKIKINNLKLNYQSGFNFNKDLDKFKILYRSPGWSLSCPGIKEAQKKNVKISSPMNFFFENCPSSKIIGVTGSKGKGTTATLIYRIIKKNLDSKNSVNKVFLGGNIGIAPLSFIENIKQNDFIVLELSSFQLEDLKYSPKCSVITNLFKEHLSPADPNNPNYHSSFYSYWQAKLNIAKHKENKYLVINKKLEKKIKSEKITSNIILFEKSNLESKLSGEYNKENIAAAIEVAKILKIKKSVYTEVIKKFKNLEHRLELVAKKNNVCFFDNSFSTTPESTIADLESFGNNIIQIAGGADKGSSFKQLAKKIKEKSKYLILFPGEGTKKIISELNLIKFPKEKMFLAKSMKEAVKKAIEMAKENDIILLSTACASFGLFKNYKERGNLFKKYVKEEIEK